MLKENSQIFSEDEARAIFRNCSCYQDSDFINVEDKGESISITYTSNQFSSADGKLRDSMFNFSREGGHTFISFQIQKNTRERIYGLLHIRKEYRGRGYGKSLVEAMEKTCKSLGTKKIRTHSHRSPEFWRKMGYRLVNREFEKDIT